MNKLLFRTVFFCLSVLSLYSCRQDDETDVSNESGDLVAVNIPIEGVRVESADSPLTRVGSAETLTVTEDLEDGFVLETSLMPVSAGLTRTSSTTGLASDVQILAIAYRENGTLYKCQYFTPGSPIIHLPKGERFKLVFYSYNSTTPPDISKDITGSVNHVTNGVLFSKNASLNDKSESHKNNVMWGRIDLTPVITSGTTLPGVTFTHLFSRLDWQLRSVVGNIAKCSGSIRNTYRSGNIKLGNLVNVSGGSNGNDTWVGTGNADYTAPITFDTTGNKDITSSKTVFCPNVGQALSLGLERITVGGKTFTNKSYTFSTKLKRGVDYRVVSTIKRRMAVTFRTTAGGEVAPKGERTANAYGERVSSVATPNSGYRFDGWYKKMATGDVQVGNNWENVQLNGSKLTVIISKKTEGIVYEARFVRSTSSVTFTSGVGGTVTSSGLQEGSLGEKVKSTASPNSNRVFDGWYRLDPSGAVKLNGSTGDESVNNNRLTVTLNERTAGKTYEARFAQKYALEWAPGDLMYENGEYVFADRGFTEWNPNLFFIPDKWKPSDGISQNIVTRPVQPWGADPCSRVKWDGGRWRMPTGSEFMKLSFAANGGDVRFTNTQTGQVIHARWSGTYRGNHERYRWVSHYFNIPHPSGGNNGMWYTDLGRASVIIAVSNGSLYHHTAQPYNIPGKIRCVRGK